MKIRLALLILAVLSAGSIAYAQEPTAVSTASMVSAVPRLIRFSGIVKSPDLKPFTTLGITFLLYKDQQGGAPLWMETQNVQPDAIGHYSVQLGSTQANGVPMDLFASGEARWLGVQVQGQAEQPRVLLLSVPYALKAADAETVGGLPPSAFVLATAPVNSVAMNGMTASTGSRTPPSASISGSGTTGFLPEFTGSTTIGNSAVFQTGASPTAKIGINTNAPGAALEVAGAGTIRGLFTLPATGAATAAAGKNSQPQDYVASVFNSGTAKAVSQTFQWQAEPLNNNTTTASGSLNLLYGSGTGIPAETGLKVSNKGLFTFPPGQTFPGTGTVISVGLSAPATDFTVSGSPVTTTGTLNFAWKVAPTNLDTANAIVKRDSTGSFNATNINASGQISVNNGSSLNPIISQASAANAAAIVGFSQGPGLTDGVLGSTKSSGQGSSGVIGIDQNSAGSSGHYTAGVTGDSLNPFGIGVLGFNGANGLSSVFGQAAGFQRIGVWGDAESGGVGFEAIGVVGSSSTGVGMLAQNGTGSCCAALVVLGGPSANAQGSTASPGVSSNGGNGDPNGVDNGGAGVIANGGNGGMCTTDGSLCGAGGDGITATGGAGNNLGNGGGFPGEGGDFTGGATLDNFIAGDGIHATPGAGCCAFAGVFQGDIIVTGAISAGTKDFKIDHPLDPANKYLVHASVESSEMKNIYDGNVITDAQGLATVRLPEWFEVLNTDFRYQLTVIGQFAQAIVAHEIENHEFTIRTSAPNVKVSWQVTGVRQDAFAKAHPLVVEEEKRARLKGFYIHPELYGAPKEKQIEWARHPQLMKRAAEGRTRPVGLGKAR